MAVRFRNGVSESLAAFSAACGYVRRPVGIGSAAALLRVRRDDDGRRALGLHLCRPVFENGLIIGVGIGMNVGPIFVMIVGGPHRVVAAGLHVVVAELHEDVVALLHQRHHFVPAPFEYEGFQGFARFGEVGNADFVVEPAREHLAPTAVRFDRLIGDGGIAAEKKGDGIVNFVDLDHISEMRLSLRDGEAELVKLRRLASVRAGLDSHCVAVEIFRVRRVQVAPYHAPDG